MRWIRTIIPLYVEKSRKDARFKGKIKMYALESFMDIGSISGKTVKEACIEAYADGRSDQGPRGGGGGGGSMREDDSYESYGTDHDPGSSYNYWPPSTGGGGGRNQEPFAPFVEVGQGEFGDFGTDGASKSSKTAKDGDCPEDKLLFPINEYEKITNLLTGKTKCVYKKLLMRSITEPGIMQRTYIEFNKNLNYKEHFLSYNLGKLPNGTAGRTKTISPVNFQITINSDMISDHSPIEIARTLVHESIHALLRKHMHSDGQDSFIEIFSKYIKETKGAELQHAIMAGEYITPLANALKKFDDAKEDDSFYRNLAWNGIPKQFRDPKVTSTDIHSATNKARSKGLGCN